MADEDPLSPLWWVKRLHKAVTARQPALEAFDNYYCGNHPLPWIAEAARDEFKRIMKMTRANYMGLVVDAMVERMQIVGFRVNENPDADKELWRIWQANGMDAYSDQALLEAGINGMSYLLVAPNEDDPKTPLVTVEHPSQAIVEYVPGTARRKRAAGLKLWQDDLTQLINATLFLAADDTGTALVYKYEAEAPPKGSSGAGFTPQWKPRTVDGESWPAENPLGVVPLIELANNPRLLAGGVSELADVTDIQDRINKTLADRLITQDYGAFPQKWATAWPEEDDDGRPTPKIDVGRNRMVTSEIAETTFGQWEAASLDPYSSAKREDVKDIASRTRTPAQYLLGEMSNVNGETLKASESGLVSKCKQRMRTFDDDLEEAARLLRQAAGLAGEDKSMEVIWRNPEFRTEGELVDALTKMAILHVPEPVLWERWGASPTEIQRWLAMNEKAAAKPEPTPPVTVVSGEPVYLPAAPAGQAVPQPAAQPPVPGAAPAAAL